MNGEHVTHQERLMREAMWRMIERSKQLADYPISVLRSIAVGFECDEEPTKRECKAVAGHKSRGELIAEILVAEFDHELTE